jgi:hypothetical protein
MSHDHSDLRAPPGKRSKSRGDADRRFAFVLASPCVIAVS